MVGAVSGCPQISSQIKPFAKNNNVNNKKENELPPSNQTYRKNGKKVRKNLGFGWGGLIATVTVGQCVWPFLSNIKSLKCDIIKHESNKELAKLSDKPIGYDVEKLIKDCQKDIAKNKKGAVLAGIAGLAAGLGAVLLTNHHRDKKRAKLAAEPEKLNTKV